MVGLTCRLSPGRAAARPYQIYGRYLLKRGRDLRKDQSYFLFSLRQDQLARAIFPLGEKTKSDTREVARHCQLKTADKEESMEICFVPDNNYGGFLQQANLVQKHRGEIVDLHGHVLGQHDGIEFYTIGQRKGLGITTPKPVYVVELDAENNRVVVGDESALDRDEFIATELQLASVRQIDGANRSHGENPLQPSRHAGDGDADRQRLGEGETAHAAARHHARPGGGVLSGRSGGRRRLDCAVILQLRQSGQLSHTVESDGRSRICVSYYNLTSITLDVSTRQRGPTIGSKVG